MRGLEQKRRAELAKIHIARQALGLSEDDYRGLLHGVAGVASAGDLDARGRASVLAHLHKLGWRPAKPRAKEPQLRDQADKIRALWLTMHGDGIVADPSEKALAAYCKRMVGVDRPEWLKVHQANTVIESLKQWRARVEAQRCGR